MKKIIISFLILYLIICSCEHRSLNELVRTAESYESKDDYRTANIVYDEIIKAYPDYDGSYINKGANLAEKKMYRKAISTYNQGLKKIPNSTMMLMNIGFNYNRLELIDSANYYFTQALKFAQKCTPRTPNELFFTDNSEENIIKDCELYYERGLNYYNLGEYDLCIEDMRNCIICAYNLPESHYFLGMSLHFKGSNNESCIELNTSADYGITDAINQVRLLCEKEIVLQND